MQLPNAEDLLAELRKHGRLSVWQRCDGEDLLRWIVSELVSQPLLADLLSAFERHVSDTLAEFDPAVRKTDATMSGTDRVHTMSPAAQQVFGEVLFRFGLTMLACSMTAEHFDDDDVAARAGEHFAAEVRKFFRRPAQCPGTLLSGQGLNRALGPALYEHLALAIAKRAAEQINSES